MTLETTIKHNGTEMIIDLDELQRYGQYYLDRDRNLIIKADVLTHGTKDSRFVRETITGNDYTIEPVFLPVNKLRDSIEEALKIDVMDQEAKRIARDYSQMGVEVVCRFAADLHGDRILIKADSSGIVSTDVEEPLVGWEHDYAELIDRVETSQWPSQRDIIWELFGAVRDVAPGDHEYSARIELTTISE
ncbi:hypothetical protein JCM18237_16660 [Halorubrum luteum]